eukprot:SAG22_NODE_4286_length_1317_cov_1.249589_2_plen_54_part_00
MTPEITPQITRQPGQSSKSWRNTFHAGGMDVENQRRLERKVKDWTELEEPNAR